METPSTFVEIKVGSESAVLARRLMTSLKDSLEARVCTSSLTFSLQACWANSLVG